MADQPRQPAGFLKTCNTDGSVFFQESPGAAHRKVHGGEKTATCMRLVSATDVALQFAG